MHHIVEIHKKVKDYTIKYNKNPAGYLLTTNANTQKILSKTETKMSRLNQELYKTEGEFTTLPVSLDS